MADQDQKTPETEPQIEAAPEIEDSDLETVTGGLISGILEDPTKSCVTSIG